MAKLTEKQEKFAQLVGAKGLGQSEAYRQSYDAKNMADQTVWTKACVLMKEDKIAARIDELRSARNDTVVSEISFDIKRLMETYVAIALVDPNELISQRVGACRHCWGLEGAYQWKEAEYLKAVQDWDANPTDRKTGLQRPAPDPTGGFGFRFTAAPNPECVECEGEGVWRVVPMDTTKLSAGAKHLYRGVQQTKEGVKIIFANQDKALENIGRMLGAFDDKLRVDLEGKVASLKLTTSDPKEAADAYAQMISSGGS